MSSAAISHVLTPDGLQQGDASSFVCLVREGLNAVVDMVCRAGVLWLPLAAVSLARSLGPRDPVPDGYYAAPYYPAPYGGWLDSWKEAYAKAEALVSQMTLAEKTNITSGTGIFMGKQRRIRVFLRAPLLTPDTGLVPGKQFLCASG